ncbi:hypothetical protein DFP72DRAFT_1058007 [Ephemerocybe angulata]|uniref:Uncharacterized protein n=1 Tax=Ephemerocybe angulata TaxID=980116 RepID=A0A8H6IGV9_9AGAR|nr:hypothetical protein DFP72DRAFT_1058007 [Tulosesus angulatus]
MVNKSNGSRGQVAVRSHRRGHDCDKVYASPQCDRTQVQRAGYSTRATSIPLHTAPIYSASQDIARASSLSTPAVPVAHLDIKSRVNKSQAVNASRDWPSHTLHLLNDGQSLVKPHTGADDDRTGVGPTEGEHKILQRQRAPPIGNDDGDAGWGKRKSCQYTRTAHARRRQLHQNARRATRAAHDSVGCWVEHETPIRDWAGPNPTAQTQSTPPKPGVDPGCRPGAADTFLTSSTGEWPSLNAPQANSSTRRSHRRLRVRVRNVAVDAGM